MTKNHIFTQRLREVTAVMAMVAAATVGVASAAAAESPAAGENQTNVNRVHVELYLEAKTDDPPLFGSEVELLDGGGRT